MTISERLSALAISLPNAGAPAANYVPVVRTGNLAFVAGQVCSRNGEFPYVGELGGAISIEEGQAAARLCALNLLSQLNTALGDLDRVTRVVRLNVFVRSAPQFTEQPRVANGASDLMVELFGERGWHTRAAVGVCQLPFGAAVEVDAIFEVL